MGIVQAVGLVVALIGAAPGVVFAQGASAPAPSSAEERAAQLRAVVGLVTTPDRELNIANFEQIMESNDVRRIEAAIRTLIASDDPALRGIAMRGYLAVTKDLVMDVVLSPNETRVLEEARREPNGVRKLQSPYRHLFMLSDNQMKVAFTFTPTPVRDNRGKVLANNRNDRDIVDYVVRGDRITFRSRMSFAGYSPTCEFELKPGKQASITGVMSCDNPNFSGPVALTSQMF